VAANKPLKKKREKLFRKFFIYMKVSLILPSLVLHSLSLTFPRCLSLSSTNR